MRPRSVIPGRQRWDVGVVLGRPRVAELLEAGLRELPGVGVVRVNPVTGRLLVYHDTALSSEEVGQLVRETVALAARQTQVLTGALTGALARSSRPELSMVPARVRQRHRTASSFALVGSVALALALTQGRFLRRSPLVCLWVVLPTTVVIVLLTWRKSSRSQQASVESAWAGEGGDHLGYVKHDPAGRDGGNSCNGKRSETSATEPGPVETEVPLDRESSFEPEIVAKRPWRLPEGEDLIISLSAKELTTGEISAHLAEISGAEVSRQTIPSITEPSITDRVVKGMAVWQNRQLDPVYPVIFIDCVNVKVPAGNVANRPFYLALAVTVDGHRDILGSWAGEHGDAQSAKYWLRVLSEIKNRGTQDCCIVVCDGLTGLPQSIGQVWPQTIVQTCIVHLLRNSFRFAPKKDWSAIAHDLKPVYTAASEQAALNHFVQFSRTWEKKYPTIIRLWTNAWAEFVPFLAFDQKIRTMICTTNAVVSINAWIRRAVNACGHFPTEQAVLECVYLAIMSLDPTGKDRQRWSNRWKAALKTFEITFGERLPAGRK